MRGADLLMRSLAQAGVELCLANPGTSEMHLVKALDAAPGMRAILTLHEGVASGAADGWGRMTGRPASTLLHLGPGLANALANLHNARRSATPVVNIVGDHATYHLANDPPLHSDLPALARASSAWVESVPTPEAMADAGARAVQASMGPPGAIATLIVPADAAWGSVEDAAGEEALRAAARTFGVRAAAPSAASIDGVAQALRSGEPAVLLLGGRAVQPANAERAGRVAAATGAKLCSAPFSAIAPRGAGSVATERLPYFPEMVLQLLAGVKHLILVDAPAPVAFFAYPGLPGRLVPEGCTVHVLASGGDDVTAALDALVVACGAGSAQALRVPRAVPPVASGAITPATFAQTLAATLPEGAIVCDEAITNRFPSLAATVGAAPHDWLDLTGGALGLGMPMALGAALACPGRRVVNLQADGSAMYTPQALWSLAREGTDVTTVVLANRRYRILEYELMRLQLTDAARGRSLTDLSTPPIDFVQLAGSLGVPAVQVTTAEALGEALRRSYATPGPQVIEAVIVE